MKKPVKDSLIYLVGEIVSKFIPFLMLPYLTRVLGVENFGYYSLLYTIYFFLTLIMSLSQDGAIARAYYKYGKRTQNYLIYIGITYSTIILVLCILILIFFSYYEFIVIVLASFFNVLFLNGLRIRQCRKQPDIYIRLLFLSVFLTAFVTILLIEFFELNEWAFFYASTLSNIIVVFYSFSLKPSVPPRIVVFKEFKFNVCANYLLALGVPTFIHQLAFVSKGYFDRLILVYNHPVDQIAYFSAGFQLASILTVVFQAINKALNPYLYEAFKNKKICSKDILFYSKCSLFFCPIFFIIAYVLPEELIVLFLGGSFASAKLYFNAFVLGISLSLPYLILVSYLFYVGENKIIAKISVISSLLYLFFFTLFQSININYSPYSLFIANLILVMMLMHRLKVYEES